MKKTLALVLALLVAFSMFSVVSFAADGEATVPQEKAPITVIFIVDGNVVQEISVQDGTILTPYVPAPPEKADTEMRDPETNEIKKIRYTFKGWKTEGDDNLYHNNTFPVAKLDGAETRTIIYTAEFSEKDISDRQSFWNFIESIFERINLLFEYFATVFNW